MRRFLARNRRFSEKLVPLPPACATLRAIWRDASHARSF
jgi:hypothetical protein